ncbi:MAG: hypothetical protein ACYC3I_14500 [Gemmataceae bacterium]
MRTFYLINDVFRAWEQRRRLFHETFIAAGKPHRFFIKIRWLTLFSRSK